ncbi:calmodulin-binding protein 60 B-like isoform X2 [Lotus japonicus]|uniref:calmodulin-binding protein 60 B-like isoform X2 n=1 Tax=Lotus japonicus TaxID=34305 RepID=UPI002587944C|nr:calmodulin-binding protein 60 B-like isoform X2 [Lotus japonicus]
MVSNRQSHPEHKGSGKIPIEKLKPSHGDTKQASSISGLRNLINALQTNDHESYFETFLQRVVREEVEHKVQDYLLSRTRVNNQAGISGAKPFQLCFINKLPDTIFTQSNIISEDESPLQIALFDVKSQSVVSDGPFSSIKIEICALNGDFGSSGNEDWTEVEFNDNILHQRDGKQPLLIGERFITLKNGVCCIPKIGFSDNSRWVRSRKFRLGAKVVQPNSNGEYVKEGASEAFVVKDNRGEAYKKHYPPSLKDDIWRLKKIAKEGIIHKRLSVHGIHTVKDFLQLYTTNTSSLYELQKLGNIPKKSWLAIIEHANTCLIDDYKLYSYRTPEQPIVLLFNSIFKLVGVTFDCQNYYSLETLAPGEKHLVEIVKQDAYKNVNNLKPIDETILNCLNLEACLKSRHSVAPVQDLQYIDISASQGIHNGYVQPFISASYDEGMYASQIYADPVPEVREIPQNNLLDDEFSLGMYIEGDNCYFNGSHFPLMQCGYPTQYESSENGFYFGSCDGAEFSSRNTLLNHAMDISRSRKPKVEWCKIRAAIKWVISVRKDAAARKNAMLV